MELPTPRSSYLSCDTYQRKASSPIEIPIRRTISSPITSSIKRSTSPELIFDMSPDMSDFPSPSHISFGLPTSHQLIDHEPFMYQFPVFPAHTTNPEQRSHLTPQTAPCPVLSSSPATVDFPTILPPCPKPWVSAFRRDEVDSPSTVDSYPYPPTPATIRTPPAHKITGFIPVTSVQRSAPIQARLPDQLPHRSNHLSPPPRSSSFSSSPWILPGNSELLDRDVGSVETNQSAFEFEKYLIRRIESEKPVQFSRAQPRSMRVSTRG